MFPKRISDFVRSRPVKSMALNDIKFSINCLSGETLINLPSVCHGNPQLLRNYGATIISEKGWELGKTVSVTNWASAVG